ncbi:MAG: phosphohydrolase, partial [Prevotella pallens]|nr:phosphohydrolase [Prevotella pallens]
EEDSSYLMQIDTVQKDMYDINDDRISILSKDGSLKDITEASEILNVELLSKKIRKYYFCYHRI